jgi:integrase
LPRDSDGKRKQQWVSVKGTKKDAEKKLAELLHQVDTGGFVKPNRKTTVAQFLEVWLKDYAWALLSPKTAEGYQDIVQRHLIPNLGMIPLTELSPKHIQAFYTNSLSSGRLDGKGKLSSSSVLRYHQCLHSALESAVRWGWVARNAADAVHPPHAEKYAMNTLDEDGIKKLLEAAQATPYYGLFHMALYTGMRRSELLALRWCDVDLLLAQVSVSRSMHKLRNGNIIFKPPKSAKGRRTVALAPSTCLVLREHLEKQKALCTMVGKRLEDNDLIFSQPDGAPLLPDSITHAWVKLARNVGLPGIRLHDARHTHASLLLKQGVHPKVVQERLGHASIAITLDTYSHVTPGLQEAAAKRFEEVLQPKE